MITQCCVCKRFRKEDRWVEANQIDPREKQEISHGYCPICAAKAYAEIREYQEAKTN